MSQRRESVIEGLARLARLGVEWNRPLCLIGGMAFGLRVRPRHTDDLDVVVSYGPSEVDALLRAAQRCGYDTAHVDRELAEAGILRLGGPTSLSGLSVDLIAIDSPFLESLTRRASPLEVGGVSVPVATLEDLVLLKLDAHRPKDIDDVLAIKDVAADQLDRAYLEHWARELGVLDRLTLYFGA
ncbi:MAG: nucleotidyl transferase AbiEii/AbiGii toxin family protein [Deltaproteobacteria bacterium]|nr:nucleotidyl transferase AbiEii/AbiGii toxin family protein [Deltaproteobacteria bacterium]